MEEVLGYSAVPIGFLSQVICLAFENTHTDTKGWIQGVTIGNLLLRVSRGFHVTGTLPESHVNQKHKRQGVTLVIFNESLSWVPRNGYSA